MALEKTIIFPYILILKFSLDYH